MKLTDIDIHDLIPQQEPFVAIGTLVECDEHHTVTSTHVGGLKAFLCGHRLEPAGIIENIAQTCAAGLGYANKYLKDKPVQIGYIGAIRNLDILMLPSMGMTMTTEVRTVEQVFGMSMIEARVKVDDLTVAYGTMKIALVDTPIAPSNS